MTQPQNSFQTNFGRFYAHPKFALERLQRQQGQSILDFVMPGVTVKPDDPFAPRPSVTNIIGMLDKKFLPPYYAKLVAEYAIENLDNLRWQREKFGDAVAIGILKAIVNQPNPAAAIGDEVHDAIDALVKNAPPTPLSTPTAVSMFAQFTHFLKQAKPEIVASEFTVWSYTHGYAGTGDLLWRLWDALWLVDTKSGNRVYPEVALQTSSLAHADVILDVDGNESPLPATDIQGVLHVRPRSVKLYQLDRTDEAFETFLSLKRAFDWTRFDRDLVMPQEPYKTEKPKEEKS